EVSWNGFGSAYYGQALSSDYRPYGLTDNHVNFTTFSNMGLNVGAKINDDLAFAAQLVALGSPVGSTDKFGLIAQWAYVNYTPSQVQGLSIRGGRQLAPIMMASEYVRVGYLLPYRQIPAVVYNLAPITRFDGVGVYQTVNAGIGRLTLGVFGGSPALDTVSQTTYSFGLSDLLGAVATLDGDGWRVRAQASRMYNKFNLVTSPSTSLNWDGHSQIYSAGARYDKHNVVFWGEYLMTRAPDGTPVSPISVATAGNNGRYVGSSHGYYLMGGYRLGNFLPRYTFAQGSNNYNLPVAAYNGKVTSHTVGLNYTAGQAVLKAEFEHDSSPAAQGAGYLATTPAGSTATSGNAFFAGVDFIF
ncbi:MAG: hypothetical protein ACJ763_04425, partial [Bdellovibrionia bacterium]